MQYHTHVNTMYYHLQPCSTTSNHAISLTTMHYPLIPCHEYVTLATMHYH